MEEYHLTKIRVIQWLFIAFLLVAGIFSYFHFKSRAAQTTTDNRPSFEAPLKTDLNLSAGIGTATYSRADGADRRATVTDWEGLIRPVKAGEARFTGARRVENLTSYSENMTSGKHVFNGATVVDADTLSFAADTQSRAEGWELLTDATAVGRTFRFSLDVRGTAGDLVTIQIIDNITYSGTSVSFSITADYKRYTVLRTVAAGATGVYYRVRNGDTNAKTIDMRNWQFEDVTGQANQNPSEYVSTNVKTAFPYHGAGVDGVKYFTTQNGNTVASNVVTEATGAAIPEATLKGYLAEGARTNIALQSGSFDNASWTKSDSTATADSVVAPNGRTDADLVTEGTGGGAAVSQNITVIAATNYVFSVYLKAGNHDWTRIAFYQQSNTNNQVRVWANLTTGVLGTAGATGTATYVNSAIQAVGNGWYRVSVVGTLPGTDGVTATISASADNSATRVNNGTRYLWGAQFEQASFASSYIPTTSASVTRAADSLAYPMTGNFNDVVGSASLEFVPAGWTGTAGSNGAFWMASYNGGSSPERRLSIWEWQGASNNIISDRSADNTVTRNGGSTTAVTLTSGTAVKVGTKWDASSVKLFGNGSLRSTDSTLTLPYDSLGSGSIYIGRSYGSNSEAYSSIKNVRAWKKALADTELNNLTSLTQTVSDSAFKQAVNRPPNNTGLVGYWSFEDGSGTKATDFSDNGNHGTLTNGPTWTDGRFGKAVSFDGTDDYITTASSVGIAGSRTVSFWMKPDIADANDRRVFYSADNTASDFMIVVFSGGYLYVVTDDTYSPIQRQSTSALSPGQWYHVAITKTTNNINEIYINGVAAGSVASDYITATDGTVTEIGGSYSSSDDFDGTIDEVRVYNRVLLQDEILNLYQRSASAKMNISQNDKVTNGLIGLWSFNGSDISGTTAYDRSGQGNNGTLMFGPVVTEGKIGQALSFDGVNDYVTMGARVIHNVSVGQAMSISSWVRGSTPTVNKSFLYRSGSCLGWSFYLDSTGNIRLLYIVGNNGCTGPVSRTITSPATTYGDNQWHHVVGVIDRPNLIMYLYIDGSSVGTIAIDNTSGISTADLRVGTDWNNGNPFAGAVDEVRIYNRALSSTEVMDLYGQGR